ncbi:MULTISPECIES: hypothetical protein [unclassified Actinomyces]|uniref:hypothetical protein n=1 Tax=unclassified Actinomyces TaxID=2609248 RepID=UPI002017BD7C|nr:MULTISPECIES: hypothetical protein [unclassified Actinomyces]MCL3789668.1 hypothetical protein [Actinomyces sp. 187325]MCL3794969.1 hypothetical protein [Actinomyces sp. 217892]
MSVTAWGDESVRRRGVGQPVYLLGAYLPQGDGAGLTADLLRFERGRKLHWRDAKPRDKRAVCQVIGAHEASHIVVAAAPLVDGVREERARQRALASLLVILEQSYSVDTLVLERRERSQDEKDEAQWAALTRSGAIQALRLSHVHGGDEPRLWVPDQVLGAYGDSLAGDTRAWEHLAHRVRVEHVSLA